MYRACRVLCPNVGHGMVSSDSLGRMAVLASEEGRSPARFFPRGTCVL